MSIFFNLKSFGIGGRRGAVRVTLKFKHKSGFGNISLEWSLQDDNSDRNSFIF